MAMEPAARAGMALCDVDTPALIIDLDAFERNLRRMADAAAKAGLAFSPALTGTFHTPERFGWLELSAP